jgi:hypothetical protein
VIIRKRSTEQIVKAEQRKKTDCLPCIAGQKLYIRTALKFRGKALSESAITELAMKGVETGNILKAKKLIDDFIDSKSNL